MKNIINTTVNFITKFGLKLKFDGYKFVFSCLLPSEKWEEMDEKVERTDGFIEHRIAFVGSMVFRKGLIPVFVPIYLIEDECGSTAAIVSSMKDMKPLRVTVNESFFSLSSENQQAVLLHEAGHIVCESPTWENKSDSSSERVYEKELAADKFAASIIGSENYCDMLWELTNSREFDEGSVELLQRAADLGDQYAKELLLKWEEEDNADE